MMAKYKLAPGTQVREEDFGLLFYTQAGPRLYFLPSGHWLRCDFFHGRQTLSQWLAEHHPDSARAVLKAPALDRALALLRDKGVLLGL